MGFLCHSVFLLRHYTVISVYKSPYDTQIMGVIESVGTRQFESFSDKPDKDVISKRMCQVLFVLNLVGLYQKAQHNCRTRSLRKGGPLFL